MKQSKTEASDPLVKEMRETKQRLAARFDYDATRMLQDAQRRQARTKRKVVSLSKQKTSASLPS